MGSPRPGLHLHGGHLHPHHANDIGYLGFFTKVVEWLEGGAKKVGQIIEEECRNLLTQASKRVFSHLLRTNPCFDFEAVIAPIPEVIHDSLGEAVDDHVNTLNAQFVHESSEDQGGAEENEGDDGGDVSP